MRLMIGVIPLVLAALVATACFYALSHHKAMQQALPPSEFVKAYEIDAMFRRGVRLVAVRGTGSMAPYIPAGPPDKTVAWVEIEEVEFDRLKKGELVVFAAPPLGLIVHSLAQRTAAGWITTGLHNHSYDSTRVYPENLKGRVVRAYILE